MSQPKHTPGPWKQELQQPGKMFTAIGGPVCVVGGAACGEKVEIVVGTLSDWGTTNSVFADACLIAAAPDLLAVAHMVLDTATVETPPALVAAAEAAIRKVGGGA